MDKSKILNVFHQDIPNIIYLCIIVLISLGINMLYKHFKLKKLNAGDASNDSLDNSKNGKKYLSQNYKYTYIDSINIKLLILFIVVPILFFVGNLFNFDSYRINRHFSNIFYFSFFALLCFCAIIYSIPMCLRFRKSKTEMCCATIDAFLGNILSNHLEYKYSYSYTVDGKTYLREDFRSTKSYNVGDKIDILYNKKNVNKSISLDEYKEMKLVTFFLPIIFMITIFVCYSVVNYKINSRQTTMLKEVELYINVPLYDNEINDIEEELNQLMNNIGMLEYVVHIEKNEQIINEANKSYSVTYKVVIKSKNSSFDVLQDELESYIGKELNNSF